ncbi:MAG TPA: tetratricopeptide repeat protein, partial [Verrucomicrobiae bacterium]|nr:tetratricopeptide repeat protein [Verrucomicrobiae bacterium]
YSGLTNGDLAAGAADEYLTRYPNSVEEPEVRFDLATALKALGRNNDSLKQVLFLLQEQSAQAGTHPENWAYWQQRAGNLIANQFYREGDYPRALDIYASLAQLNASPQWQLPVWYQIGMTYEHLLQPDKAADFYRRIVRREPELGTNAPPGVQSIVDMARWRVGFLQWQNQAERSNRRLADTNAVLTASAVKPVPTHE